MLNVLKIGRNEGRFVSLINVQIQKIKNLEYGVPHSTPDNWLGEVKKSYLFTQSTREKISGQADWEIKTG